MLYSILDLERRLVVLDRLEERVEVPLPEAPAAARLLLLPRLDVPLAPDALDDLQKERRAVPCGMVRGGTVRSAESRLSEGSVAA